MPQTCTVCRHSARIEIERAIISGAPMRTIAGQFALCKSSVARHRNHILAGIKLNAEVQDEVRTSTIMADIEAARERSEQLYIKVENLLSDALANNDGRMAIQVIRTGIDILREARACSELRGQITGEFVQPGIAIAPITIVMPAASVGPSEPGPPTYHLALPSR